MVWHFQFRIPATLYPKAHVMMSLRWLIKIKSCLWCRIRHLWSHWLLRLYYFNGKVRQFRQVFTLSFYKECRWWCYKYDSQGTCYKLYIRHGKSQKVKVDGVVRRLCSNGRFCLFGSCDSGLLNFRYYYYYPDYAEIIIAVYFLCHSSGGSSRVIPVILGLVEMIHLGNLPKFDDELYYTGEA